MPSVKKNYLYSLFFQLYAVLLGVAIYPYLSRVLGPKGLGISAYIGTVVNYFALFGTLSSDYFASREFIYSEKEGRMFWNIWFLRSLMLGATIIAYITLIYFAKEYKAYFSVGLITLLSNFFNVTWYYYSIENFKTLSLRNFVVRTVSFGAIFFLVRSERDLLNYLAIGSLSNLVANLVIFPKAVRENSPVRLNVKDALGLFPGAVKMFLPEISISVYAYVDKLMIEWLSGPREVGLYEAASKIPQITLSFIAAMTPIMMSRLSNTLVADDTNNFEAYVRKSLKFSLSVSTLFTMIFLAVGREFIPWFYGASFVESVRILYVKVFILICISLGTVAGHQSLVALRKEKYLTISVTIGAIVNVVLNFLLIPNYKAFGAAVASLGAEILVTFFLYLFLSKFISLKSVLRGSVSLFVYIAAEFLLSASLMPLELHWPVKGFLITLIHIFGTYYLDTDIREATLPFLRRFLRAVN